VPLNRQRSEFHLSSAQAALQAHPIALHPHANPTMEGGAPCGGRVFQRSTPMEPLSPVESLPASACDHARLTRAVTMPVVLIHVSKGVSVFASCCVSFSTRAYQAWDRIEQFDAPADHPYGWNGVVSTNRRLSRSHVSPHTHRGRLG